MHFDTWFFPQTGDVCVHDDRFDVYFLQQNMKLFSIFCSELSVTGEPSWWKLFCDVVNKHQWLIGKTGLEFSSWDY